MIRSVNSQIKELDICVSASRSALYIFYYYYADLDQVISILLIYQNKISKLF